MGSSTMCCIEAEFCCKKDQDGLGPLPCCCIRPVGPTTCIKQQQQCCCYVSAMALPPDDEVPCMISFCGANCYPKPGCGQKIKDITSGEDGKAGQGGTTIGSS